jgi:hypothetical protein
MPISLQAKNQFLWYSAGQKKMGASSVTKAFSPQEVQSVASDSLMTMKWCDKPDVRMFSSLQLDETDWKMEPILKPKYILDYSGEKWVQQIGFSYVHGIHKSIKWYKELSLHILDIALLSVSSAE